MTLSPPSYVETPHTAYVNFFVKGKCITKYEDLKRPRALQSFSFENSADSAGTFHLQLFDPTWHEMEEAVIGGKEVTFFWGYENGGIRSRQWAGTITSAVPSFTIDGIMLSIEGICHLGKLSEVKKTTTYPNSIADGAEAFKTPDQWVRKIAEKHQLKTTSQSIEPCREVKVVDAFAGTEPVLMRYTQQAMTDLQFIKNILAPMAVSKKTGEAGYIVYVDEKDVLHFKPAARSLPPAEIFIYMREKGSEVISFEVDYSGFILPTMMGFQKVTVPVINALTGQIDLIEKHNDNTPEKVKLAGNIAAQNNVAIKTKQAAGLVTTLPEKNYEAAEVRALTRYYQAWNSAGVNAKLTIVGTDKDTLQMNRTCTVIVKAPNGDLHHTSGNYLILGKKDEIAGGRWTTTLTLVREGARGEGDIAKARDNTGFKGK